MADAPEGFEFEKNYKREDGSVQARYVQYADATKKKILSDYFVTIEQPEGEE